MIDDQTQGREDMDHVENGGPFSMCMACLAKVAANVSVCPRCHVPVSVVRKCPACEKIVSSLHGKCVYCGCHFVVSDAVVSTGPTEPRSLHHRDRNRGIRAAMVSVGVFTAVFILVLMFSHKLEQRMPAPRLTSRVATSYALRSAPIFHSSLMDSTAIAHVPAATKVDVVDFETAGTVELWWHIKANELSGYVRPLDFAPPRVVQAERGYFLLRSRILAIDDSESMAMAIEAVQYYRSMFPQNKHGDELLYETAQKARQVAANNTDAALLARAREMLTSLTTNSELSQKARTALEKFPAVEKSHSDRNRKGSNAAGIQMAGVVRPDGRPSAEPVQTLGVVNPTDVLVVLPSMQDVIPGMMLQGRTAREMKAGDILVPAGSICELKVLARSDDVSTLNPSVLVQVTGLQVSGRRITADGVPTRVPISSNHETPPHSQPVTLKLKTPLLLHQ